MVNILFVCSANRFRSVIAAEYLRSLIKDDPEAKRWHVSSAGIWTKNGLPPLSQARRFAESQGMNIDQVQSREISKEILHAATLIIVMTGSQKEALEIEFPGITKSVLLLSEICEGQVYDIPDPIEEFEESPEGIGTEICSLLYNDLNRFKRIVNERNRRDYFLARKSEE